MSSTFNFNGDINFTGNLYKNNSPYLDYYSTQYFLHVSDGNPSDGTLVDTFLIY